jgi:hypothetical protein
MQMLSYVTEGSGPRLAMIIHHTDEKREWAYDRQSPIGRLDKALNKAETNGWKVVSIKDDWNIIHPVINK